MATNPWGAQRTGPMPETYMDVWCPNLRCARAKEVVRIITPYVEKYRCAECGRQLKAKVIA